MEHLWIPILATMDINVVSHGGVSSNYLVHYLQKKGFSVLSHVYEHICHYPKKLIPSQKCIYIYGDIPSAILSMHRRNFLLVNMNKIRIGVTDHVDRRDFFLQVFPDDPVGIKAQISHFRATSNTAMLKYPYTLTTLKQAFDSIGVEIDLSDFKIRQRTNEYRPGMDLHDNLLERIIYPYLSKESE